MFWKKEEDPTTKLFDDEEWIRSLTEAQEISAHILEENVTYDRKQSSPFRWENSCGSMYREGSSR